MIFSAISGIREIVVQTHYFFSVNILVQLNVSVNEHFQQKICSIALIYFSSNLSAIERISANEQVQKKICSIALIFFLEILVQVNV